MVNKENINKYYELVNKYIDNYVEKHNIKPTSLAKYLLNNDKLINFINRNGLSGLENIKRVIKDVIDDRVALEKDTIPTFENFIISNLSQDEYSLLKGIDNANILHEKLLSNYLETNLSHIDIVDINSHIFKVDDNYYYVFTINEVEIIKLNFIEYIYECLTNGKIISDEYGISIEMTKFIDKKSLEEKLENEIKTSQVKNFIEKSLDCISHNSHGNFFVGLRK